MWIARCEYSAEHAFTLRTEDPQQAEEFFDRCKQKISRPGPNGEPARCGWWTVEGSGVPSASFGTAGHSCTLPEKWTLEPPPVPVPPAPSRVAWPWVLGGVAIVGATIWAARR